MDSPGWNLRESLDSPPFSLCETFDSLREANWINLARVCESGLFDSRQNSSPASSMRV